MNPKQTFQEWENSLLDLDEFLQAPCEIDEKLANYIGEVIAPAYLYKNLTQGGDAIRSDELGVLYYMTVSRNKETNKFYYLGVLPEFKQSNE